LKPWFPPRTYNLAALNQLIIATRYNYKMDPTSTQYIRRAVELDSSYVPARVWLIQRLLSLGSREEALHHHEYLKSIQRQCSSYEQVMIDYAGAFVSGDTRGQMNTLQLLLEYSPGNNILLFSLARLQYMNGDYEGCAKSLEPAIETHWKFPLIYYYAGASFQQLGRDDKARALLEESLTMGPIFSDCYRLLSVVCRSQKDTIASQKYENLYLSTARHEGTSAATAYGWLASLNEQRQHFLHAADLFGKAIAEQGNVPNYHLGLANVFLNLGDTLRAQKEFAQVLVLDTTSAEAHYRLAEILERQGNNQQSLEHTKEYLRLAPTGEFSSDARSRMLRLQHK
jgi:tetratricopeptide (TPR) repeat protein